MVKEVDLVVPSEGINLFTVQELDRSVKFKEIFMEGVAFCTINGGCNSDYGLFQTPLPMVAMANRLVRTLK